MPMMRCIPDMDRFGASTVTVALNISVFRSPSIRSGCRSSAGDEPITVKYMFEHADEFQIGARHSKDD